MSGCLTGYLFDSSDSLKSNTTDADGSPGSSETVGLQRLFRFSV